MDDENTYDAKDAQTGCRAEIFARANFNFAQSSQLFINCCFAISFGGVFFVAIEGLKTSSSIPWTILSIYVVFAVWRQYSNYLIPLQFYRNKAESYTEEMTTFAITFALALFPVVCFHLPGLSLIALFVVLLLNILKLEQMKRAIRLAPRQEEAELALEQLSVFSIRLGIHLGILVLLFALLFIPKNLSKGEFTFAVVVTVTSCLANIFFVQWIYTNVHSLNKLTRSDYSVEEYVQAIASAWRS
jgi:hypothetical protein